MHNLLLSASVFAIVATSTALPALSQTPPATEPAPQPTDQPTAPTQAPSETPATGSPSLERSPAAMPAGEETAEAATGQQTDQGNRAPRPQPEIGADWPF